MTTSPLSLPLPTPSFLHSYLHPSLLSFLSFFLSTSLLHTFPSFLLPTYLFIIPFPSLPFYPFLFPFHTYLSPCLNPSSLPNSLHFLVPSFLILPPSYLPKFHLVHESLCVFSPRLSSPLPPSQRSSGRAVIRHSPICSHNSRRSNLVA